MQLWQLSIIQAPPTHLRTHSLSTRMAVAHSYTKKTIRNASKIMSIRHSQWEPFPVLNYKPYSHRSRICAPYIIMVALSPSLLVALPPSPTRGKPVGTFRAYQV